MMDLGVCFDNRETPPTETWDKLRLARPDIVATLWINGCLHRRGVYEACEQILGDDTRYMIRVGPSSKITPNLFIAWAKDALGEVPVALRPRTSIRILNEVNLVEEGDWTPAQYGAFLTALNPLWRAEPLLRGVVRVCSPVSLGREGWREWWDEFRQLADPLTYEEGAANLYAHNIDLASDMVIAGKPMHLTEISTLELSGAGRADWILQHTKRVADLGYISAQQFIIGGSPGGAWPDAYIMSSVECVTIGARPL